MTLNVSAKELKKIEIDESIFDETVNNTLQLIEEKIRNAHANRKTSVAIELPYVFGIDGIDNKDSRLIVYSRIIEEIKRNGFAVKIKIVDKSNRKNISISVAWKAHLDNKKIKKMQNIIADHLYKAPESKN